MQLTFVVGDIHGEITKLILLVEKILKINPAAKFVFIGDYIDKGEDSKQVLDFLQSFSKNHECVFIKGNHEYYWQASEIVDSSKYLEKYGGLSTVSSFRQKDILSTRKVLFDNYDSFFKKLVSFYVFENFFICHSGLDPSNLDTLPDKLNECDFYFNRYEFIKSQKMYLNKYRIIFGHTGFVSPYLDNFKIGIDTAACFSESQPLTSYCLNDDYFVDSNLNTYSSSDVLTNCCPAIVRTKPWRQKLNV